MFFRLVPQDIDKEAIFPLLFLAGPGLYVFHVDAVSFEDVEHFG